MNVTNSTVNENNPFTEIFDLLLPKDILFSEISVSWYTSNTLRAIQNHIGNALNILLQGLQDLGFLINFFIQEKVRSVSALNSIGFFISVICNLIEALIALKSDTDYILSKQMYR